MPRQGVPLLELLSSYVDVFPNWRSMDARPWRYLSVLLSLVARGELEKHRERAPLKFDPENSVDVVAQELIDLLVEGRGKLSVDQLLRLRDMPCLLTIKERLHATIAGLIVLREGHCELDGFDFGRPSDPGSDTLSEARYHYQRERREADDVYPWANKVVSRDSPILIPAGLLFAREMGLSFGEVLRNALERIDADLFREDSARLEVGGFKAELRNDAVVFREELLGEGGLVREALAVTEMGNLGTLDAMLTRKAAREALGNGMTLREMRKVLSKSDAVLRREIVVKGDIEIEDSSLEPYRRREESMHAWTKQFHPKIAAGVEMVLVPRA